MKTYDGGDVHLFIKLQLILDTFVSTNFFKKGERYIFFFFPYIKLMGRKIWLYYVPCIFQYTVFSLQNRI
jgi:hypothetical protein